MTDDEILRAYMRPYGAEARKLIKQVERLRIMALGWAAFGIYQELTRRTHE